MLPTEINAATTNEQQQSRAGRIMELSGSNSVHIAISVFLRSLALHTGEES